MPVEHLLQATLALAVPLKIADITSGRCPITTADLVPCEWCGAEGSLGLIREQCRYPSNKCLVCDSTGQITRAHRNGHLIAERGDSLLFKDKTPGVTAALFNLLAESLALLAIEAPGGVKVFDQEWCARATARLIRRTRKHRTTRIVRTVR